ncbi:MAG: ATP-binding protein [Rhodoferax sp.]|nr:ATP-binding protein [Rhodoferax sp.]
MKLGSIHARMLMAALLPAIFVAVVLSALALVARVGDLTDSHNQRARSLVRQLAASSEYGLFSANVSHLQALANSALREPDVDAVTIVDGKGQVLVRAGQPDFSRSVVVSAGEGRAVDVVTGQEVLWQPIAESLIKVDDLFETWAVDRVPRQRQLGHVLIEFSRKTLDQQSRDMLLLGAAITLAGLLFGGILAVRLGQGVVRPILRVSGLVERLGRGELSARSPLLPGDPLRDLQWGLNQMAQRLESGRDELEQRIAAATAELREKKEEAETATRAKSRFLAAASHDLRQPTHAMGMFVARLAQLPHDSETRALISHLDASVRATQDLLDALLDVSRLDAHAVPVQTRPFALAELFSQVHAAMAPAAQDKGLRLRVRPTGVWLMSDPSLLYRIVLNLVGNALRYTPVGTVLVACRVSAGGLVARIEVWDSGIGIAPEHHQEIFKEFVQVGNPERDRGKGMGLGLNIVERTAQLLGHPLSLRSRLGRGTRFSVEVPLAPVGAALTPAPRPERRALDDLKGLAVLVIEDDALARNGLVGLLASWGAVVGVAEGLASVQALLQQGFAPDVLVSDYQLRADENGIDIIAQVRTATGWPVPACLMSGNTDPALMVCAKQAGLTLLHKPVRPAKLRSLIRRLVLDAQAEGADMG